MVKETYTRLGSGAFLIGLLIAVIVGIYQAYTLEYDNNFFETIIGGLSAWSLATIGIIVGILTILGEGTITEKEIPGFLMAGISLMVMGAIFQGWAILLKPFIGALFAGISMSLSIFVAPAVGIIAVKSIWDIGKDR